MDRCDMPAILLHDDLILYEIGIPNEQLMPPPFFGRSKKRRNA